MARAGEASSSRAWASLSLMPSSITYSKVMKSRGAFSGSGGGGHQFCQGYFWLIGTNWSRRASLGACSETARATGHLSRSGP